MKWIMGLKSRISEPIIAVANFLPQELSSAAAFLSNISIQGEYNTIALISGCLEARYKVSAPPNDVPNDDFFT
jgi:hypothetical protein